MTKRNMKQVVEDRWEKKEEVVELLGISKLEYAVKICMTNKATTRKEVDQVLSDLRDKQKGKM